MAGHWPTAGHPWHALAAMVWRRQVLRGEGSWEGAEGKGQLPLHSHAGPEMCPLITLLPAVSLQVSADKLDSIMAFPKYFSQASYAKLASYRRAVFQALEVGGNITARQEDSQTRALTPVRVSVTLKFDLIC